MDAALPGLRVSGNAQLRVLAVIPGTEEGQGFVFARRQVKQLQDLGADVASFYLGTRTQPMALLREAARFRRMLRSVNPHVVHAHYGTVTGLFCVLVSRVPVVITFRGSDLNPSSEYSMLRAWSSRCMSRIAAALAREVVCVTQEIRDRIRWRTRGVEVIRTGVDLEEFYPMDRDEARRILGWSLAERVVLFNVGTGQPANKRRDLVEQAIGIVGSAVPSVRLIVMQGDVPASKVPLYLNAADVVVMASDYEGSPNIVKEALACNVPVCTVDVGDVRELIAGVGGCLMVERTAEGIAGGLIAQLTLPTRSSGRLFSHRYSSTERVARVREVLYRASAKHSRAE